MENLVVKRTLTLGGHSWPQKFYLRSSSSDYVLNVKLEDENYLELMELPFLNYSSCIKNMIKQNKILNI